MISTAREKLFVFGLAAFTLAAGLPRANAESASPSQSPPSHCTNKTWRGAYGFTLTGWRIPDPAQPTHFARAGVGRLVSDGQGNLIGIETKSKNGLIVPVSITGTYQVNPDCTGSAHIVTNDPDEHDRNFNFTVVEHGEQVMAIQTDQGRAVTVLMTKQIGR